MDILILGNGFDLAHGLNTKYSDFLEYCRSAQNLKNLYANKEIKLNIWLQHFLYKVEKSTYIGENWIDLEEEIFQVIKTINNNLKEEKLKLFGSINGLSLVFDTNFNFEKFFDSAYSLKNIKKCQIKEHSEQKLKVCVENVKYLSDFLYEQLRDFVKLFEKYLDEVVMSGINSEPNYRLSLLEGSKPNVMRSLFILNFNYTDTLIKLYEQTISNRQKTSIRNFYVHGKIKANNIVLGTRFFNNNTTTNIPTDFNVFRKHNQRHKYNTIEEYQNLLRIIKSPNDNSRKIFHVIGHSLDKSDYTILKHIFLANKDSIINIYYHNEETQEKLINNITEIIGEEEVMSKVKFIDQHDAERGILIPIEKPALVEAK